MIWNQIDIGSMIFYLIFFILFPLIYMRMSYWQALIKINSLAELTEKMTLDAKRGILKKIKRSDRKVKEALNNFMEFFLIQPVSLDPFGIVKKIDHLLTLYEKKFKYFVNRIAPSLDSEEKANLLMTLSASISLHQITKILRHYAELIKKTKNIQIALIVQMQLPFVEKYAKALHKGVGAFLNGWPIGDSIGNLVAAKLMGKQKPIQIEEDTILVKRKIRGRNVLIIKSQGPGGRLGKLDKAVEKVCKKRRIAKIITIDASLKLEGEKTGSVAEGIGVAIGGMGVEKAFIEDLATKRNIPLDSIIIKMSEEEAIKPMSREIFKSLDKVCRLIEENIEATKERGDILIVGVGNSCGIDNNEKAVGKVEKIIKKIERASKARRKVFRI